MGPPGQYAKKGTRKAQKSPGRRGFQDGSGCSWRLQETIFLAEQAGFEPAEGY